MNKYIENFFCDCQLLKGLFPNFKYNSFLRRIIHLLVFCVCVPLCTYMQPEEARRGLDVKDIQNKYRESFKKEAISALNY